MIEIRTLRNSNLLRRDCIFPAIKRDRWVPTICWKSVCRKMLNFILFFDEAACFNHNKMRLRLISRGYFLICFWLIYFRVLPVGLVKWEVRKIAPRSVPLQRKHSQPLGPRGLWLVYWMNTTVGLGGDNILICTHMLDDFDYEYRIDN